MKAIREDELFAKCVDQALVALQAIELMPRARRSRMLRLAAEAIEDAEESLKREKMAADATALRELLPKARQ